MAILNGGQFTIWALFIMASGCMTIWLVSKWFEDRRKSEGSEFEQFIHGYGRRADDYQLKFDRDHPQRVLEMPLTQEEIKELDER